MPMLRLALRMLPIAPMLLAVGAVSGQDYPAKSIRIITSAPGGSSDFMSRLIAPGLTERLGQQVIADNRGNFGGEILAKVPSDGYTLLVDGASLWTGPLLQKTPYDPVRDFAPVTIAVSAPNVIVVHPSLPVKSVKELIALAKARPGELNYGSGGIGGASHLPAELFKSMAGVNIVNVNYKGTGQAINALVAGEIQLMFANATIASPQIKVGRLRGVAVASLQRSALLPDLPTVAASGLPGFESVVLQGILTRANTPAAHVSRLNQEIVRVLNRADVKERLFSTGVEIVGSSPEELATTIRSDIAKWGKVIKDAGIRVE
jgi:tripartite-type tricarboxylate transporter receptor subunit TctC